MQTGEEKKEENQYQDLSQRLQVDRSLTHQRSKARSPSPAQNRNTWLSSTLSKSSSGSTASSMRSATISAIKTPFIATTKAPLYWPTTQSTMHVQSISTFNITSSGTVLKMERCDWSTAQRRTW